MEKLKESLKAFNKAGQGVMRWEEYELVPGMIMTVRFEDDTVDRFLGYKASFRELKKLRVKGSPKFPGMDSASPVAENLTKGEGKK